VRRRRVFFAVEGPTLGVPKETVDRVCFGLLNSLLYRPRCFIAVRPKATVGALALCAAQGERQLNGSEVRHGGLHGKGPILLGILNIT